MRRGYLLTQIAGGVWADKFGGKPILGFGVVWWSVATALTPIAAQMGLPFLLAVRACMGIGEGVAMPAMNNLLSRCAAGILFFQQGLSEPIRDRPERAAVVALCRRSVCRHVAGVSGGVRPYPGAAVVTKGLSSVGPELPMCGAVPSKHFAPS